MQGHDPAVAQINDIRGHCILTKMVRCFFPRRLFYKNQSPSRAIGVEIQWRKKKKKEKLRPSSEGNIDWERSCSGTAHKMRERQAGQINVCQ